MINIRKLEKIKSNFPVLIAEKAIPKNICKKLISEISSSKSFDDIIMGGRSRINKGSKNFKVYLKNSKYSSELFRKFNSKIFFKKLEKIFKSKFKENTWTNLYNPKSFNQKKFTPKRKVNSKELTKLLGNNYNNPILNLDIDFSVSKGGYRLRPHRDDVNRLYNFLIYLTEIPKKNGGSLTLYKKKKNKFKKKF